jgi:ribosomal protein L14E/L6E/L27E
VDCLDKNEVLGRVVFSKSGRDIDRRFLVVDIINEDYVYIADGDLRRIEKPKKKKLKHLCFTCTIAQEIKELLIKGVKINNSKIKGFLQSEDTNKEV